ncbi:hypothetical protein E4T52_02354 [Aureobasidium sp. EXF-3400]|nr:hypothetical protein E4T51_13548 [Aureobasidium sp. EXF-12344]KAI4782746.1 hypothetical protein E4T52_02354 [Aureobasidium sp. EXF-3400]
MPSFSNIVAAMAFTAGIAQAIPQYQNVSSSAAPIASASKNASSSAGSSKTSSAAGGMATLPALAEAAFCPKLNGGLVGNYLIECGTTHFGTILSVGNGTVAVAKRAVYTSLGDCINLCSSTTTCVGTAFDTTARTCTLYSEVGQAVAADGIDFAVLTNPNGASVSSGAVATSTIFSTNVITISSCAPTVTNCPLKNGNSVITQIVPVSSTEYICPTASVIPASAVACGCAAVPVTVTQYSPSAGSMVPVQTVVVNSPVPTATVLTTTVCTSCAQPTANMNNGSGNNGGSSSGPITSTVTVCNSGKCSAVATTIQVASATSSKMAVYTGAADSVKAMGGFAAFIAGAAVLL